MHLLENVRLERKEQTNLFVYVLLHSIEGSEVSLLVHGVTQLRATEASL